MDGTPILSGSWQCLYIESRPGKVMYLFALGADKVVMGKVGGFESCLTLSSHYAADKAILLECCQRSVDGIERYHWQ